MQSVYSAAPDDWTIQNSGANVNQVHVKQTIRIIDSFANNDRQMFTIILPNI